MAEETKEPLEFGEFTVRAIDEGGEEVRLTDQRNHSNLVLRKKTVGRGLERGQRIALVGRIVSAPEEETVTVEVPADETAGLTPHAKVLEESGVKKAKK